MDSLLKVENLYISNNDIEILKDISLEIKKGEILAIVGESGSGKSTLIRALIQMMDKGENITSGKILFKGKDLSNISSKKMRMLMGNEIGVVFQNPGSTLNPIRKIGKQFVEVLQSHMKITKKEALEKSRLMLEKVNLSDAACILNSYPFELSGGMKQRVAMALALVMEPELLVADEPTSALDVTTQSVVVKEMVNLCESSNISIVIVTHSMGVARYMAKNIAVMYAGTIVEYGDKEEILKTPKHPYTRALINAIPKLDGKLPKGIKGNPPKFNMKIEGCAFADRCDNVTKKCNVTQQALRKISNNRWVACTCIGEMEKPIDEQYNITV